MKWQIILSKQAKKDVKKIASSGLKPQAQALLEILQDNAYQSSYENFYFTFEGGYSFFSKINLGNKNASLNRNKTETILTYVNFSTYNCAIKKSYGGRRTAIFVCSSPDGCA